MVSGKHLEVRCIAVVAAVGLMALLGASSASATVICKETPTGTISTARCDNDYVAKQVFKFKATNPVLTSDLYSDVMCLSSEASVEQANTGGTGTPVTGKVTALTFSGCTETFFHFSCTVKAVGLPFSAEIHWISGTHDGTVEVFNGRASVSCPFIGLNCVFGAAALDMELESGNPARVTTNEVELEMFEEPNFTQCPTLANWDATYVATSPTAIYIAQET
jgi:hypothetical protein